LFQNGVPREFGKAIVGLREMGSLLGDGQKDGSAALILTGRKKEAS